MTEYYPKTVFPSASATQITIEPLLASTNIANKLKTILPPGAISITHLPTDQTRYSTARPSIHEPNTLPQFPLHGRPPGSLATFILAANTFLLDGYVHPTTIPAAYQSHLRPPDHLFPLLPGRPTKSTLVNTAITGMIWLRSEQTLKDGNHRTALLCGLEYLYLHGFRYRGADLSKDILVLYILLGKLERGAVDEAAFEGWRGMLRERLGRRFFYVGFVGGGWEEGEVARVRRVVKGLPVWASLLFFVLGWVDRVGVGLEERRAVWRWVRRGWPVLWEALVVQRGSRLLVR
ncbi:hypothetical protein BJ508DRAFT_342564 [Ascobolus immersus RN42]|uniref:Uncharacterized protein n=1 Tax=Ascobolus immersus RN42 TaxID=1160509 RepID=A0A3N4IBG0_ASCIM|nr:hypothetical protein BJ508DRAFT_342564 [Ascobolus immersus RN42]